jgi:hypothetical protein
MTTPRHAVELMMKEARIRNIDMIIKEAYKLKEVARKYYLDISGKERETGIRRAIIGSVAALICNPSETQKKLLKFLSESKEVTRALVIQKFGVSAYNLSTLALYAMGMVDIENRFVRRRNRSGYYSGANIFVIKPRPYRIKKFWQSPQQSSDANKKANDLKPKANKGEKKNKSVINVDLDPNHYRDGLKFLEDKVSLECFIDLHSDCQLNGACQCGCHERASYPIN